MTKLYYNGQIITMTHKTEKEEREFSPEAVLVVDDKIADVGNKTLLENSVSHIDEYIDLNGKCLMPAFIDSHSHFVMNGEMMLRVNLSDCESFEEIVQNLKNYLEENHITENQAIIGFGYDQNFLKELNHPDKSVLDQVSSTIPILVLHVSLHLACANSAALNLAGINSNTPNPPGGLIGRMGDTPEPSGYLEEIAAGLVQEKIIPYCLSDINIVIDKMQDIYLQNGITTVQDGVTSASDLALLKKLADNKLLKLDIVSYPLLSADGKHLVDTNPILTRGYHNRLRIGGYKLILDGSPQGRSAWMSEPYLGEEKDYCGYPYMSNSEVEKYVLQAINEKKQILVHCNGDAASEQYLNAYEKALEKSNNAEDLRPVMIHCQTVRNDQLDRMKKINMIASIFVGHVWYWGDVHVKNFGVKRGHHISPAADALKRGLHVTFHQDTPVTKPDMLHSVWCAVNRISKSGQILGAEQRIDVYSALRAVTIEGAYQYNEEKTKGIIEKGKCADLIILDKSPLAIDPIQIKDIVVLETIKSGIRVYKH